MPLRKHLMLGALAVWLVLFLFAFADWATCQSECSTAPYLEKRK